ncbi:DNA polymerase III subunit beta [Streptomyces malaysiensis]|uniref:DNA polymerase III subunit beta n=1 Tax=Streptomyces malaysiensis TaxID=92644 RepID=UPI0008537858|nr:DNA polymerase III subunit beta [Streptomyces sp. SPMA113]
MKLTIDSGILADTVAFAARALPARPPVPVMAGLKLTAADGQLNIAGFDYDTSATASAAADIAEKGSVLVSGRLLSDITRALKRHVRLSCDGTRLVLESGPTRFTLHTLPLEEYPTLPTTPAASGIVSGKDFADAAAQIARAASRDETLPVLTGVSITADADADILTLAATDRYRFAVRSLPWDRMTADSPGHALVPAKTLLDTAKALADDHEITVGLPGEQGTFGLTGEHSRTTVRAIDGDLPKYKALFPTEFSAVASVETAALTAAVKRVALVATGNTPVRLGFTTDTVTIEAGASDDAQAIDRVAANLTGEHLSIAFNPTFLLDGLNAIGADTTQFNFTTPGKPTLLHGAYGDDLPQDALRYLLMPVRLSN